MSTEQPAASQRADQPLIGQVVVVTGASAGIGAAAAQAFSRAGAELAIVGRSLDKTAAVAARVRATPFVCDFARLEDVRRLAAMLQDRYPRIDVLANNAGMLSRRRELSADGHELTFQVNHLAPFLLTNLLSPCLGAGSRVIQTSSRAQFIGYVNRRDLESRRFYLPFQVYGTTKLENVLFTTELQRRWGERGVSAAAFHPGTVRTEFGRQGGISDILYTTWLGDLVLLPPERGADTLVWLATTTPGSDWVPGGYYAKRRRFTPSAQARRAALARWLWDRSAELVGLR